MNVHSRITLIALAALSCPAAKAMGSDVAAVLSSGSPVYRQAFEDFQKVYGSTLPAFAAGEGSLQIPAEVRVVVSFGARAALQKYPETVTHISCLSPGLNDDEARDQNSVRIRMLPRPARLLPQILELHPSIKRLKVFWVSDAFNGYVKEMETAARKLKVAVSVERLARPEDMPERVGALKSPPPDAIWIPPDPSLITGTNIQILIQYSDLNRVPFFSPTAQFVEMGATAAVFSDFEEIGRAAAAAVRDALAGRRPERILYPDTAGLYVNRKSAENIHIQISPEVREKIRKIY